MRVIRAPHAGVAAAATTALAASRGEIVARMDADDRAHPNRLRAQLTALLGGDVDVVGGGVAIVDARGAPVASMQRYQAWLNRAREPEELAALRFVEMPLANPTLCGRREAFELGYRDRLDGEPIPEDYDWFLRAVAAGVRFGKVDEPVLDWVDSPDRLTRRGAGFTREAFDRCRRAHLVEGPLVNARQVDLWGVGQTGKPWLDWLRGAGREARWLYDIDPRRVGQRMRGGLVRHAEELARADGTPLLIAVGAAGARDVIAPRLRAQGYVVGGDAWFVA